MMMMRVDVHACPSWGQEQGTWIFQSQDASAVAQGHP